MRLDEAARQYLGIPWAHQGRNPEIAIDCIGLGILACRDCGIDVPDEVEYGRDPINGLLESSLRSLFGDPASDIRPGDIVAVRYGGNIRHVGIVGEHSAIPGELTIIHTDSRIGRVVEHRID
ncbi:MAG TPA: NlpC/P60 family protein, partial [Anaerolineales bacterium]|nr:NlpC/P60 family protein [Anaerolineales bacterium]